MNAIIPSQIKVSSVLNKDVTSYGKQHIFDGSKETCWNSDSGDNQFIKLKFDQTHKFKQICFTFQGGFSASQIDVLAKISDASVRSTTILYPTDTNDSQTFQVDLEGDFLEFKFKSTDFFGRIILYSCEIY